MSKLAPTSSSPQQSASRQLRVAMVAYTFYNSDPRVRRHVRNLTEAGYAVDVIALHYDGDRENPQDSDAIRFFLPRGRDYSRQGKFHQIYEYTAFMVQSGWCMLRNHLSGHKYDVVHINNMPNFLIFGALPLRLLRVPVLLDVHDTMPEIYQERFDVPPTHWMIRLLFLEERWSMRLASYVITTEHTKWERLIENGLQRKHSKVTLNLPDPDLFPLLPLPDKIVHAGDDPGKVPFRIVYHGTLARRLGLDIAIRAVGLLCESIPNIRFEITGDGEFRPNLVALVEELGLQEQVVFSDGFLPTDQVLERLTGAHLAVIPSRPNIGTRLMLPTKLLEYFRLGIPAITVPTETIRHYFTEEMVCFVAGENPEALAETISGLYKNPERRLQLAQNARKFFDTYNFESERDVYLQVMQELVQS